MPLDPVPWFVGGGAEHSPEVARTLAYAATGGAQGIVQTGDLKVTPTGVPSGSVQVAVGAALILSNAVGGKAQSYVARMATGDTVPIAQTTSSGGRSDLVVIQVEDPFMSGEPWQDPADPTVGPYVFVRVIPNVPSTATSLQDVPGYAGRSAVTLARIDIPAATGTVTAAMIKDLRKLAQPRSERQIVSGSLTTATTTLTTSVWQNFPVNPITGINVPSWATHAVIRVDTTLRYVSGDAYANFQAFLGPAGVLDSTTLFTDMVLDASTGNAYRQPLVIPSNGYWSIPASLRGKPAVLTSRVVGRANGGKIASGAEDYYFADITFLERAA